MSDDADGSNNLVANCDHINVVTKEHDAVVGVARDRKGTGLEHVWEVHPSPYGTPYYYSVKTGESRWTLPTGAFDVILPPESVPRQRNEDMSKPIATTLEPETESVACKTTDSKGTSNVKQPPQKRARATTIRRSELTCDASPSASSSACPSDDDESSSSSDESDAGVIKREIMVLQNTSAALQAFSALLRERGVGRFDSFEKWQTRLSAEPRFLAVPADLRRQLFLREARQNAKVVNQRAVIARQHRQKAFEELLRTNNARSHLRDALLSGTVVTVDDAVKSYERSELAHDERWHATHPSDRKTLLTARLKEASKWHAEEMEAARQAFLVSIEEKVFAAKVANTMEEPSWDEVATILCGEPPSYALLPISKRRELYIELGLKFSKRRSSARREDELKEENLAEQRKREKRSEMETELRNLLETHVRQLLQVTWAEAKVLLAGVKLPTELDEASRELIFNELRAEETQRGLAAFAATLRELPAAETPLAESSFQAAQNSAAHRMPGGASLLRLLPTVDLKHAWEAWRCVRLKDAEECFVQLLKCRGDLLEAVGDAKAREGRGPAFDRLCERLSEDLSYRRLDLVPTRRKQLIVQRLVDYYCSQSRGSQSDANMH